ncbi:MAG: protein translocase subunit SecD [Gemmatimonadetes bacterium]|nr:protein translocase subunit SecD [Gemmatimonadota bacterium]
MASIRNRLIFILLLVTLALVGLWPRQVVVGPAANGTDSTETQWGLKLGLDLQGGMHLAVEIDQSGGPITNPEDALDRAETVIRSRIDEFGVAEPLIQKVGTDRIIIQLPGIDDPARAKQIVERSAFLEFRITDMDREFERALDRIDRALVRAGVTVGGDSTSTVSPQAEILNQLLGAATDTTTQPGDSAAGAGAGADSVDVATEGPSETIFSSFLNNGALPGEVLVVEEDVPQVTRLMEHPEFQRNVPRGIDLLWGREPMSMGGRLYRGLYAVASRPIITGDRLSDAQAQLDPITNQAVVNFQLTRAGGRIFGRETAEHINDYMAIVLDGRVQGQPPIIRGQIRRQGQIELGNTSIGSAQDLALVLRAGALPAPIHIVEERTVGASLGEDSIRAGRLAGIVAIVLVIGIIAVYYRMAGLVAIVGLSFYVLFTLGGLASLNATLTLPGLAGFVLSLGLAVDANVLIFERIREEIAMNRSPRVAVESGFDHAMPAIIDGNVTTIITAAFLFQFGTGPVQGFAVTLIIGIVASLLTAVFVTKTLFLIWLQRRSAATELSI